MMEKTWTDPIVEEVRAARERIFKECDYDLEKLGKRLQESEKRHGNRLVTEKLKRQQP